MLLERDLTSRKGEGVVMACQICNSKGGTYSRSFSSFSEMSLKNVGAEREGFVVFSLELLS